MMKTFAKKDILNQVAVKSSAYHKLAGSQSLEHSTVFPDIFQGPGVLPLYVKLLR